MNTYSIKEVTEILLEKGVVRKKQDTDSLRGSIELVRRWIRNGTFEVSQKAEKSGQRTKVTERELEQFIEQKSYLIPKTNNEVVGNDELKLLKEENERLKKEIEELKKQTANEEIEEIKDLKYTKKSDDEKDEEAKNKTQEYLQNTPFSELTEEKYERLVYTLFSNLEDENEIDKELESMKKQLDYLKMIVNKNHIGIHDRMVIKGLKLTVTDILERVRNKEQERIGRIGEVKIVDSDEIKVYFRHNKNNYVATVKNHSFGRSENWLLKDMRKPNSKRPVSKETMEKLEYDVIKKTFELIHKLEREEKRPYFLLSEGY